MEHVEKVKAEAKGYGMKREKLLHKSIGLLLCLAVITSGLSGCGQKASEEVDASGGISYGRDAAMAQAAAMLAAEPLAKASLLSGIAAKEKVFALTFDGLADHRTMERVFSLLEKYQVSSTFFVTGVEAAEDAAAVKSIIEAKQTLGSNSLKGQTHMEELAFEEMVGDFAYAAAILEAITGQAPELVKCRGTLYTDDLLAAAAASGFRYGVKSGVFVNYQSFNNYDGALGFISRLEKGSILSVKMKGVLDGQEYAGSSDSKNNYMPGRRPAGIKGGTEAKEGEGAKLSEEERLLRGIEWLLQAAKESGWRIVALDALAAQETFELDKEARQEIYLQRREANKQRLAKEINLIHTTERAAALSFYGIGNGPLLQSVLDRLAALNMQATFFVSENDIIDYPERVKQIVDGGHEIGAALLPKGSLDYLSVCEQIYQVQSLISSNYQVKVQVVSQIFNSIPDEVKEAVSAMDMALIGHSRIFNTSVEGGAAGAGPLVDAMFHSSNYTVKRGEILHFRLDYRQQKDELVPELLQAISQRLLSNTGSAYGPRYTLRAVGQLLNGKGIYQYPVPMDRGLIYRGHLQGMTEEERFSLVNSRYIGTPSKSSVDELPGFTAEEVSRLDKTGKLAVDGSNTVFLTFDDWGTDRVLNRILEVLDKHKVKASFFIYTEHVPANPNLLRAIGLAGHDIGGHTDRHLPMTEYSAEEKKYYSLTSRHTEELGEDVVRSYKTLERVVGDLYNEQGRPVLTRFFRPPTLAVSREGMEAVLDAGYQYIVNGDFSTGDYQSGSAEELFDLLVHGITVSGQSEPRTIAPGSIIVMHMTDSAQFTPEALDQFLSWNAARPEDERFQFARISDYLQ